MVVNQIINYVEQINFFPEKVWFLSFAVVLKTATELIIRKLMDFLLEDNETKAFHYTVFINVLVYISFLGINVDNDYVIQSIKEFKRLSDYYTNSDEFNQLGAVEAKKKCCLVLQTDQMLDPLHSPTKIVLDFAIYLKKVLPSYTIIIIVEDNLVQNPEEVLMMANYGSSATSSDLRVRHLQYLNSVNIEIIYADLGLKKRDREFQLVKEIINNNPEAIISFSEISVNNYLLYHRYPMVYISMGGVNYLSRADVYLYPSRDEVLEDNKKYNLLDPEKIYDYKSGLSLPSPSKVIGRPDIGLAEDDFVLVTVGNRLDAEMNQDYIDLIGSFLEKNNAVKWVIVGSAKLRYLEEKYHHLLKKQILRLEFESDLSSLYNICNVYINPPRKSGAYSMALAMNMELPVVIMRQSSDGLAYVGVENCVGDTFEYIDELNKLYFDKEYQKSKGMLMKAMINKLSMDQAVEDLLHFVDIAKNRFEARKSS
jgi:glycosyltransferase involved in cell wall biosynthesis